MASGCEKLQKPACDVDGRERTDCQETFYAAQARNCAPAFLLDKMERGVKSQLKRNSLPMLEMPCCGLEKCAHNISQHIVMFCQGWIPLESFKDRSGRGEEKSIICMIFKTFFNSLFKRWENQSCLKAKSQQTEELRPITFQLYWGVKWSFMMF